jgi:hypothetical protein
MNDFVNHNPFTPIAALLFACCPATVIWRILSIIIYSVERMSLGWPVSHIHQEGLKTLLPSLTDYDSTASIVHKIWVIRIIASLAHRFPSRVLDGICVTVNRAPFGSNFFPQASTASAMSVSYRMSIDDFLVPAIATAQDTRSCAHASWSPVSAGLLQHGPPSEAFSDHSFGGSDDDSHMQGFLPCLWSEPLRRLPVSAARCLSLAQMVN